MRKLLPALALCVGACAGIGGIGAIACATGTPAAQPVAGDSLQMLVVVTAGWDAVDGTLRAFERKDSGSAWIEAGPSVPVVVGRAGLAWGRGLHPAQQDGPAKREGDGKSPAGVFTLGEAFGLAGEPPAEWRLPYLSLTGEVECVDDVASPHYNRLVTKASAGTPDWKSSEKMWMEPLYKWGVVVEHNRHPVQASGGSCIFLHIWRGPGKGTAGCTAMEEAALTSIIAWLDQAKKPLLVQLQQEEYARLRATWGLPGTAGATP